MLFVGDANAEDLQKLSPEEEAKKQKSIMPRTKYDISAVKQGPYRRQSCTGRRRSATVGSREPRTLNREPGEAHAWRPAGKSSILKG